MLLKFNLLIQTPGTKFNHSTIMVFVFKLNAHVSILRKKVLKNSKLSSSILCPKSTCKHDLFIHIDQYFKSLCSKRIQINGDYYSSRYLRSCRSYRNCWKQRKHKQGINIVSFLLYSSSIFY